MASIINSVSSPVSAAVTASSTNTAVHAANVGTAQAIVAQAEVARMAAAGMKASTNAHPAIASVHNAIQNINTSFQQSGTNMQFSIDPNTKQDVVQVTDTSTGKVIWQIPSKVTLAISESISQEMTRGALLYQKA